MVKNTKNGYTLTEVLIVVVIISFITLIIVPNLPKTYAGINSREYENKKAIILEAAKLYGFDNANKFNNSKDTIQITVEDLIINNYINPDVTSDSDNCESNYGCVINPDAKESLNKYYILITKKGSIYETSMIEE